jgi:hypothetical protein
MTNPVRNYKYAVNGIRDMILSIPLFSIPLLIAAAFIGLGFMIYPFSARFGVVCIGAGSVIMGVVVLFDLPNSLGFQGLILFGISIVVGGWMMYVGVKNG